MGKLSFKIQAEYEKVDRLKKSIVDLKAELMGLTPASKEFKTICSSIEKQQKEVVKLSQEVAKLETIQARTAATKARQAATELNAISRIEVATSRKTSIEQQSVAKIDAIKKRSAQMDAINEQHRARAAAMAEKTRRQLSHTIERCTNSIKRENVAISDQTRLLDNLKAGIAGVFAIDQGKDLIQAMVQTRGEFQQLQISFETMLQGKGPADKLMSQVIDFTAKTPFSLQEVAKGAKQLLAYGSNAEIVIDELRVMGDVASGLSIPIGDLIYLYGTLRSQGRANLVDIKQFAGRGVPIYEELGKVLKVSTDEVTALVSAGEVGFPQVEQAFKNMTSEGGKFFDLTAKNATSLTGLTSNLGDAWSRMLNIEGTKHEEFFGDMIKGATQAVDSYEDYLNALKAIIATYGVYKAAVIAMNIAKQVELVGGLANAIRATTVAQKLLNSATLKNPYVIAATAIAGLVSVLIASTSSHKQHKEAIQATLKPLKDEYTQTNTLVGKLKDANIEETERTRILKELKGINPDIVKGIEDESKAYEILSGRLESYNKVKLAEINIKQFTIDGGLKEATVDLEESKNKLEKQKAAIIGTYSDLFTGINQINIPVDTKSIFENIFNSEQTEFEKVEELFKEYNRIRVRFLDVQSGFRNDGSVSSEVYESAKTDFAPLKELFGGFSMVGDKSFVAEFDKAYKVYKVKVAEVEKKILGNAKALAKDPENEKKIVEDLTYAVFPSRKKADGGEGDEKKPEVQDKKHWTGEKQAAEKELDELSKLTVKTEEGAAKYKAAQKKLAEAINELKWYDRSEAKVSAKNNPVKLLEQLASKELSAQEKINATRIALMKDGADKQKAYAEATHKKEIDRINVEEQEKLSLYSGYLKNGGQPIEGKKEAIQRDAVVQRSQANDLKSKDITEIDKKVADEIKETVKEEEKALQDLLEQYQTYADERAAIEKKFNDDIAILQSKNVDGSLDANIKEAENQKNQALKAVTDSELESLQKSGNIIGQLFENASDKSISEIMKIKKEGEQLFDYLATTASKDITPNFGMSTDQLQSLQSSKELESIKNALDELYNVGVKKNPFAVLASDLKAVFKEGGNTEDKLMKIGTSASASADMIGGLSGGLSDMFAAAGNEKMAGVAGGVEMAMSSISNVASGFANGGIVGGIAAAAGELINFATMAFESEAIHQAALDEIAKTKIEHQKEYNALLVEQNLLYEIGSTIFGDDAYGKANNAISVSKGIDSDLKKQLDALKDIDIVTGHKKTGLFGWGKGKDTYSGIFEVYDDLIDAEGNLNVERAEAILATDKLSDEHKGLLEEAIGLNTQYEESVAMMNDYLTGIFGDLGNSMSDALVDAFKNGTDASKAFESSVGDMLENLAQQMIYSVTLAPIMAEAQKAMSEIMKNEDLTDEQKFNEYTGILSGVMDDAITQQGTANELYKKYQEMAADKGIDIFEPDANSQQTASGKGVQTMTQDEGSEMNGRLTALQMISEETKQENIKQTSFLQRILDTIMRVPSSENVVNVAAYSVPVAPAVQSDRMSSENLIKVLNTTMSLETIGLSTVESMGQLKAIAQQSFYELEQIKTNTGNTTKILKGMSSKLDLIEKSVQNR